MKIYSGFRLPNGEAVVTVEQIGTELQGDLPLRLDLRDHSSYGFGWGGFNSRMVFYVTVGAKELEPLWMLPYLPDGSAPMPFDIPILFLAGIQVVEMQGWEAATETAPVASPPEFLPKPQSLSPLVLPVKNFSATPTPFRISLPSSQRERRSTIQTETLGLEFDGGTLMFFTEPNHLTAFRAAAGIETSSAIPGQAVFPVGDAPTTRDAIKRRIGPHDSPTGPIITIGIILQTNDGRQLTYDGPAQLALALLADATGEDEWALARYHAFKSDWLAGRGPTWIITQEEIIDWLKKRPLTQDELVTYTMELEDRRR